MGLHNRHLFQGLNVCTSSDTSTNTTVKGPTPLRNTTLVTREGIRWTSGLRTVRRFVGAITAIVFAITFFAPIDTDAIITAKLMRSTCSSRTSLLVRAIPTVILAVAPGVSADASTVGAPKSSAQGGHGIGGGQEDWGGRGVRDVRTTKDGAPRTSTDIKFRHFYAKITRFDFFLEFYWRGFFWRLTSNSSFFLFFFLLLKIILIKR